MKIASVMVSAALLLTASPAFAGYCDEEGAASVVQGLEAYAKKKGQEVPVLDHLCMETAQTMPKLVKRTLAACTKVIAREPGFSDCVQWGVLFGAKQLGDVELFGKVGELFKLEPFTREDFPLDLYLALDDARAVPLARQAWQAALLDKRATQERYRFSFVKFRHAAIKLFAKHGGADERAFLDEQGKLLKDRGLKKAIGKAIAEIDKRAAAPAPKAPGTPGTR